MPLGCSFAHRGRNGNDAIKLTVTDQATVNVLPDQNFTAGNSSWSLYQASTPFTATGSTLKLECIPVFPAVGSGNFFDAVALKGQPPATTVPGPLPLADVAGG